MIRRHKNKKKTKKIVWVIVILALICLGYIYMPNIIDYIEGQPQKSQNYDKYKNDLKDYSVFGVDVSVYQKDIDWELVLSEQKIDFVIVRATAGIDNFDKKFSRNWKALKNQDVIKGAYHYYRPNENSNVQAAFYIKHVKLKKGDLHPILDIEKYSRIQSVSSLKKGLLNWLNLVEKHYGVTPIIYTYNNFYVNTIADDKRFDKYPVWIAWYNMQGNPNTVSKNWYFWQFTDKGKIKGIEGNVDINVFNGEKEDMDVIRIGV